MSFGTPQRVLNLKREHEKSLRALGTYSGENFNDSLDAGYQDLPGFGGYHRNLDQNKSSSKMPSAIRSASSPRGRASSPTSFLHLSDGDADDKNNTIAQLQEEIERLRGKINKVVESAEASLQDAIEAQEALRASFNSKLDKKDIDVEHVRVENVVLKAQVADLRAELAQEREQVAKGLRFADRIKHAGSRRNTDKAKNMEERNVFRQHVSQF